MIGIALFAAPVMAKDLKVRIEGINDKGAIHVYVFVTGQGFPKEEGAAVHESVPNPEGTSIEIVVHAPDATDYALMAYQDKNGDGKMNRLFGMIPQEPYALSRNPQVMGKPRFADASIQLTDGEAVVLRLRD